MDNSICNKKTVKNELTELINSLFDLKLGNESLDKPLLGKDIKLNARDLVYLYFKVKENWNIDISEELIISGKFHTINLIAEIIKEELSSIKNGDKLHAI